MNTDPVAGLVPSADSAQTGPLLIRVMRLMTQSLARCRDGAGDAGARGVTGGAGWKEVPSDWALDDEKDFTTCRGGERNSRQGKSMTAGMQERARPGHRNHEVNVPGTQGLSRRVIGGGLEC